MYIILYIYSRFLILLHYPGICWLYHDVPYVGSHTNPLAPIFNDLELPLRRWPNPRECILAMATLLGCMRFDGSLVHGRILISQVGGNNKQFRTNIPTP